MTSTTIRTRSARGVRPSAAAGDVRPKVAPTPCKRRIASNFLALGAAEVACRGTSVAVTLLLVRRLGREGYGRIEFGFHVVFWLVLLVREGLDVIGAREIARHPRLVRPLVNHALAIRGALALGLLAGLAIAQRVLFTEVQDRAILGLYGLMVATTAMGLDFVFRGLERMALVAVSLMIRTGVYATGVALLVGGPERAAWVPALLVAGESIGIGLVWVAYARQFGLPRPSLGGSTFARVFLRRGRSVYLIQVSQAVISSVDLLVVGACCNWGEVGLYSAPHRMVSAVLTFGLIFQQVVFPSLSRSWRDSPAVARRSLDGIVRLLMMALLPMAIGASVLAGPLVQLLFKSDYLGASTLLAIGVWRAPLLTLAFLYQTTLIALNREAAGVRLLLAGAIGSGPLVGVSLWAFGLPGAVGAVVLTGLALVGAGYWRLRIEGRGPAWHHQLARPLLASAAMVPACWVLSGWHVLVGVGGGALVYLATLATLGGFRKGELTAALGRG